MSDWETTSGGTGLQALPREPKKAAMVTRWTSGSFPVRYLQTLKRSNASGP